MEPQTEIMCHFIRGERLTVVSALRKYGTTELRRIVGRLNHRFFYRDHKMVEGVFLPGEKYKTYSLVDNVQQSFRLQ